MLSMLDTKQSLKDSTLEYAATTNELVLSDKEVLQAKGLLLETIECILQIGNTIGKLSDDKSRLERTAHVTDSPTNLIGVINASINVLLTVRTICQDRYRKYNIAIAPHKRLPTEILTKIFIHCLPLQTKYRQVERNEVPWALEKVCSRWRSITRNEPRLWGKVTIDLQYSPKELPAACAHLPPFVYLSVNSPSPGPSNLDTALTPYLWRVQELTLQVDLVMLDKFWTSIAGSDCFSGVEVFMLDPDISGWVGSVSEEMIPSWTRLAPLKYARSLHNFRLVGGYGSNFPLLSLHMPWSQLRTVTLACELSFDGVVQLLQLCSSVEKLELEFPYPSSESESDSENLPSDIPPIVPEHLQTSLDTPIYSRSLRDLTLAGSIPYRSALLDVISFHGLGHLNIELLDIDGDTQYQLLKQCTALTHLRMEVASTSTVNVCSGDLPLLLLCSLHVNDVEDNWLFVALMAPSLVDLVVSSSDSGSPLDIIAILDMVVRSDCSRLSSLELQAGDPEGQPHLTTLLAAIPTAINVTILGMTIDEDCLQLISVGEILPLLEKLTCEASTDEEFLRMMEGRVYHVTHTPNMSQIRSAYFIAQERVLLDELRLEKITRLEEAYGVTCSLTTHQQIREMA